MHQVTQCLGVKCTHTQAEKELVLRQGKQEPTVRSHQPHHTLYYAKLGIYCTLIRNTGVGGGGREGGGTQLKGEENFEFE